MASEILSKNNVVSAFCYVIKSADFLVLLGCLV